MIACVLLGVGVSACAGGHTSSGSGIASANASTRGYLNDGDVEKVNDHDGDNGRGNRDDNDGDSFGEYDNTYDNGGYHDGDDSGVLTFGHAASSADTRAVTAVVMRFYADAKAESGARACALMTASVVRAIPEDYGRSPGPAYLRGGKTCGAIVSRQFKHVHRELAGVVGVTGVRVSDGEGLALLGSRTMPASEIFVRREGGVWKVDALSGRPMP